MTIYLQRHPISWRFNRHRLQGITSNVCGYYCCIFALHRTKGLSMTKFMSMFSPARYNCNDIRTVRMFRSLFGECPACSQLAQSCKSQLYIQVKYTYMYQSVMSLIVIDFTYLDGRDGEVVVEELVAVNSTCKRVSSYVFKKLYTWD